MNNNLKFIANDEFLAALNFNQVFGGFSFEELNNLYNSKLLALYTHIIGKHMNDISNDFNSFIAKREHSLLSNIISTTTTAKRRNKI